MRKALVRTAALAAAGILFAAGCSDSGDGGKPTATGGAPVRIDSSGPPSKYRGTELGGPMAKPELTLTDTSGQAYDFKAKTAGKVTLLYFGYTHCPDVCPTTMADLARGLTKLKPEDRANVDVVFVTSDPQRDTGPELRSWLDAFDPTFVGLTGSFDTIQAAAKSVGVALEPPKVGADGKVTSTHGTQIIAFERDNLARIIYLAGVGLNPDGTPAGITADDFAHDLPLLIHPEGSTP
ncbi:SCO family protein [Yinghuangia seranimata]|uniref:SCO family protein n=1 Tax=Yinghuangia seranimata TaxID=408067 RepID=UPI00248D38AF|nr:SCO family protein [Yinghuangia seranimata]MDI2131902.1 SCO family protein [Yinghuangia seranimata]